MHFSQRLAKYFLFVSVAESLCVQSPVLLRNVDILLRIFFQWPIDMSDTRYLGFIIWEKDKSPSFIDVWWVFSLLFVGGVVFVHFVFLYGAWKPDLSFMHKTLLVLLSLSPGTFSSDHRALALCDLLCMNRIVAEECPWQGLFSGPASLSSFNKVFRSCFHLPLHPPST